MASNLEKAYGRSSLRKFLADHATITSPFDYALDMNSPVIFEEKPVLIQKTGIETQSVVYVDVPRYGFWESVIMAFKPTYAAGSLNSTKFLGAFFIERIDLLSRTHVVESVFDITILSHHLGKVVDDVWLRSGVHENPVAAADLLAGTAIVYAEIPFSCFASIAHRLDTSMTEPLQLKVTLRPGAELVGGPNNYIAGTTLDFQFMFENPENSEAARQRKQLIEAGDIHGLPKLAWESYLESETIGAQGVENTIPLKVDACAYETIVAVRSDAETTAGNLGKFEVITKVELRDGDTTLNEWSGLGLQFRMVKVNPHYHTLTDLYVINWGRTEKPHEQTGFMPFNELKDPKLVVTYNTGGASKILVAHNVYMVRQVSPTDGLVVQKRRL